MNKINLKCNDCGAKILFDNVSMLCNEELCSSLRALGLPQDGYLYWRRGEIVLGKESDNDTLALTDHDLTHLLSARTTYTVEFASGGSGVVIIPGHDPIAFDGNEKRYADALAQALMIVWG